MSAPWWFRHDGPQVFPSDPVQHPLLGLVAPIRPTQGAPRPIHVPACRPGTVFVTPCRSGTVSVTPCRSGTVSVTPCRSGTLLKPPDPCSARARLPAERCHQISGACGSTSYRSHPSSYLPQAHGLHVWPASCFGSPGCAAAAASPDRIIDPRSSVGAHVGPDERRPYV